MLIFFHPSLSFHKFCFLENFLAFLCNNLSGNLGYSSFSKYPSLCVVDTYILRAIFNVQIRLCVHLFILYELNKAYFSCRHSNDLKIHFEKGSYLSELKIKRKA